MIGFLVAVWLLVIGYGVAYIGYNTVQGRSMSFKEAFLSG